MLASRKDSFGGALAENGGKSTTANRGYCTCNSGGSTCLISCAYRRSRSAPIKKKVGLNRVGGSPQMDSFIAPLVDNKIKARSIIVDISRNYKNLP